MKEYFNELKEQIIDQEMWDAEHFHVFDYEAGMGKTRTAQEVVGELTKEHPYRVLYVQRFVRDNELDNTVSTINQHAGREVAVRYASEDAKKKGNKKKAVEAQVLCITTNMYLQFCKGEHKEFWTDRDILVIDEYPDFIERISVSLQDIQNLWGGWGFQFAEMDLLANNLRNDLALIQEKANVPKVDKMIFVDFISSDNKISGELLRELTAIETEKEKRELLNKFLQLLQNGCYYYEGQFHTFQRNTLVMLKSNIILDANGFDYRYELSDKFILRKQGKMLDYSRSTFYHYEVNTSKSELKQYADFFENVLDKIQVEGKKGVLFVTDKENVNPLIQTLENHLRQYGETLEEISAHTQTPINVDYFGNIIGVNNYRHYDTVVLLKTPYFDYLSYALSYFYFQRTDLKPVADIEIFQQIDVESIKKTVVAGELYQAIKRINRENSQQAEFHVFTDYQEAIDVVLQQLQSVNYKAVKMEVARKRKYDNSKRAGNSLTQQRVLLLQDMLMQYKNEGRASVKKADVREAIGVQDKGNFSKFLRSIMLFMEANRICSKGQEFVFLTDN